MNNMQLAYMQDRVFLLYLLPIKLIYGSTMNIIHRMMTTGLVFLYRLANIQSKMLQLSLIYLDITGKRVSLKAVTYLHMENSK